jgi:hypothetical protein
MTATIEDSIYSIVEENMESAYREIDFSREAYRIACASRDRKAFDTRRARDAECWHFTESLYLQALQRPMDAAKKKILTENGYIVGEADNVKRDQLRAVQNSQEFGSRTTRVRNNIYSAHNVIGLTQVTINNTIVPDALINVYIKIKPFYKKLPTPIRKLIRKILGAD